MTPMTPTLRQALMTIAILALLAWRMKSRMRRLIGRQRLSRVRPWVTIVIFPLLIAMLSYPAIQQQHLGLYLALGIVVGIGLGVLGLRLTRFEVTTEGLFYTPSAH